MIDDYSGLQKAAILLITLGPEKASAIFQHLKEDEIESLTLEIANTRSVSPQDKESVLDEYYQVCLAQQYIAEGGIGYAKELLEKALGSEKAQGVISKLTASLQVRPFEFVRKTEPAQLLNFIQDEHPQTIAMILSYLSSSQAAMILGALPPEKQADVARRIAQMDRTSPDVIKEVERVLERKLSSLVNQDYTIVGGIDSIVNILNSVDRATEKRIMESLEVDEPELAEEIRKKVTAAKKDLSDALDEEITQKQDETKRSLEKEANSKIMAINEYSDTVLDSINKAHNEIMFLYSMLNDKHDELTRLSGDIDKASSRLRSSFEPLSADSAKRAEKPSVAVQKPAEPKSGTMQQDTKPDMKQMTGIDISGIIKTQPASAAPASKAGATTATGTAAAVSVKASDAAFGTPAGSSANADVINHTHEILKLYKSGKSNVEIAKLLSLGTGEVKLIIDLYKEGK